MPVKSETLRKDIRNAAHDWMGLALTEAQITEILDDKNLGYDALQFGIDTVVREKIAAHLAKIITGREWPLYGTPKAEKDEFFRLFEANAEAKGFTLVGEGRT